ncbi:MAG: class I SAM-dependent methyltransferase [Actinomycetes bacterium]
MTGVVAVDLASAETVLERVLDGVEGWLQLPEAAALYDAAKNAAGSRPDACVVEIGSWKGRSTIALGRGVVDGGGAGTVYAIDPHEIRPELPRWASDRMPELLANLAGAGVGDVVTPIRASGHQAREQFGESSVDVLFVDGDHSYQGVCQDIDDWSTTLRPGAVVAFNDYRMEDVARALRHRVLRSQSAFRRPRWVHNTLIFDYQPTSPWRAAERVTLLRARMFLRLSSAWIRRYDRLQASAARWQRPLKRPVSWVTVRLVRPILKGLVPSLD